MSTTTPTASLTVRKILPCRPERAFRAWTEPSEYQQWFTSCGGMAMTAEMDVRVGGKYRLECKHGEGQPTTYVGGEFLVVEPPHRIEYTWIWDKESNPQWSDRSVVTVTFTALPENRCELVLTNALISDPEQRKGHSEGWTRIIDNMAAAMAQP